MAALVPILLGGAVIALVLASSSTSKAAPAAPPAKPPVVRPPTTRLGNRALSRVGLPEGTVIARTAPSCDLADPSDCSLGLIINNTARQSDGSVAKGAIAPKGNALHPFTPEEIAILPGQGDLSAIGPNFGVSSVDGSAGRWAEIISPGGGRGFVRIIDGRGRINVTLTGEIVGVTDQPVAITDQPDAAGVRTGYARPHYGSPRDAHARWVLAQHRARALAEHRARAFGYGRPRTAAVGPIYPSYAPAPAMHPAYAAYARAQYAARLAAAHAGRRF